MADTKTPSMRSTRFINVLKGKYVHGSRWGLKYLNDFGSGWGVMKKSSIIFTTIVILLLSISMHVYADETTSVETYQQQSQEKNECILLAIKCGNSILSIQDKIQLLREEIAKGKSAYTPEEIERLKRKLEEASKTLDYLLDK
jgi:hypothetical protein